MSQLFKRRIHLTHISRIALLIIVLICASIMASPTLAAAADPTPTAVTEALSAQAAPLFAKTANGGKVNVIVQLSTPFDATNTQAAQAQLPLIQQTRTRLAQRLASSGARTLSTDWVIPFAAFEVNDAGLKALINSPEVIYIQENVIRHTLDIANDNLIGAPTAWSQNKTGGGQYVAVLDTGVQANHPFFGGRVTIEACFSGTSIGSVSLCPNGLTSQTGAGAAAPCPSGCEHGTHVAGIAAGDGRSLAIAQAGVAIGANIFAVQVFSNFSGSIGASDTDILNGMNYVYLIRHGNPSVYIASVNMSLGASDFNSGYCDASLPAYKNMIDLLRSVSIATVIASGNDGFANGVSSPACISSAISVGAVDNSDNVAGFSNSYNLLTLLAPGVNVVSSFPGSSYGTLSGTSMATPQVAGAIAILKQQMPDATVSQLIHALQNSGKPVTDSSNGITTARIRVDKGLPAIVTQRTKHIGFYDRENFTFYLRNTNSTGNADIQVTRGYASTFPVVGDWNADGLDSVGTYDQTNGVFVLWDSNAQGAGYSQAFVFGNPGDRPLAGRWVDGTPADPIGRPHDGVGVFRNSNGLIYLISAWPQPPSTSVYADYTIVLGNPGWVGIAGHWYGASLDTAGVYDPSNGRFFLTSLSCNGIAPGPNVFCLQFSTSNQVFGSPGSIPFSGDWIGAGQSGVGVYDVSMGRFSLLNYVSSANPTSVPPASPPDSQFVFGSAGGNKIPLSGHWVMGTQPSTTGHQDITQPLNVSGVIVSKPTAPTAADDSTGRFD